MLANNMGNALLLHWTYQMVEWSQSFTLQLKQVQV